MWPETDWPSSAIKRTNRLNMDFVYPPGNPTKQIVEPLSRTDICHGHTIYRKHVSASMDRFIHKVFIIYIIVITESREFVIDTYALKLV